MIKELEEIINRNYNKYLTYAKNIINTGDNPQDVLNEMILEICLWDDEKQTEKLPYIDWTIIVMLRNSNSQSSGYQRKYNKIKYFKLRGDEDYEDDEYDYEFDKFIDKIYDIIENDLSWYERKVFELRIDSDVGFRKLSKRTGIPESNLQYNFNNAKNKIKNKI